MLYFIYDNTAKGNRFPNRGGECYQNDEGSENATDVGSIPERQCGVIWNITRYNITARTTIDILL